MTGRRGGAGPALAALALLVSISACGGSPAARVDGPSTTGADDTTGLASPAVAASEAVLADLRPDRPGCAAAASVDGRTTWSSAVGVADVATGAALGPGTAFDLGALSTTFTAATVLVLVEKGVIALDERIRRWLPELPETWDDVTIDHLLRDTGGVPPYDQAGGTAGGGAGGTAPDGVDGTGPSSADDALAVLAAEPALAFEPGTGRAESRSGWFLLSLIVARATGEDFGAVVSSQVVEPVGLERTGIGDTGDDGGRAVGHVPPPSGTGAAVPWVPSWPRTGDGGVWSTAEDVMVWVDELRTGAALGTTVRDAMVEPLVLADGSPAPHGRAVDLTADPIFGRVVSREGSRDGVSSAFVLLPDRGVAAAVVCNTEGSAAGPRARAIATAWADEGP